VRQNRNWNKRKSSSAAALAENREVSEKRDGRVFGSSSKRCIVAADDGANPAPLAVPLRESVPSWSQSSPFFGAAVSKPVVTAAVPVSAARPQPQAAAFTSSVVHSKVPQPSSKWAQFLEEVGHADEDGDDDNYSLCFG
jgi:hypothetical protein